MKYRRDFHFQYTISADLWYNSWNQFTEGCEKMTDIERLAEEFHACRNILHALGDENRQHMILEMMQLGDCNGACDGTIMEKAHLSRPAVSHHIQVLKDTGILKMRREGTKFFYFDTGTDAMQRILQILQHAKEMMEALPDRSGTED